MWHTEKTVTKTLVKLLYRTYGDAKCALKHENALQLLIATILSAQCTDERVNKVTQTLFRKYKTAADYANAPLKEIEKDVHSTGFFRSKAKHIKNACAIIHTNFSGKVPDSMDSLVQLPGVGRKTANVVLGSWFNKPDGVVVDTHVKRISNKLGLTKSTNPVIIEKDLMNTLKKEDWTNFSHMIIWHGRKICTARKPKCPECPILSECPSSAL